MTISPPADQQLPPLVRQCRRALELEYKALRDVVAEIANAPQPGCPAQVDEAAARAVRGRRVSGAHKQLLYWAQHGARLMNVNAYDHLVTLSRALGSDGAMTLFSHTTLSRIVCEAAVRLHWLLDPAMSYDLRLTRAAVLLFASAEDRLKGGRYAAAHLDVSDEMRQRMIANVEVDHDKVTDLIDKAGFALGRDRNGKIVRVVNTGANVQVAIKIDITDQMNRLIPQSPGWYGLSSGVAHSTAWLLNTAVLPKEPGPPLTLTPDLLELGSAAQSAISASALIIRTYASYYGHDPEERAKKSDLRRGMLNVPMQDHAQELAKRGQLRI